MGQGFLSNKFHLHRVFSRRYYCLARICLSDGSEPIFCEAVVDGNLRRIEGLLNAKEVVLTSREMSLLAVAVTEMVSAGLDPWKEQFVVQVVA